jgi:hypothetical protein
MLLISNAGVSMRLGGAKKGGLLPARARQAQTLGLLAQPQQCFMFA